MAAADSCPIHGRTFMAIHPKTGEPYCEDCRMAREGDIHYVKNKAPAPAPRPQACRWSAGCNADATCMPRLYVPASAFSMGASDDVSALIAVPFCDRHFYLLKAEQFTRFPDIRQQIEGVFRDRHALPNFDKAVLGRIPLTDPDYLRGQMAVDKARKPN